MTTSPALEQIGPDQPAIEGQILSLLLQIILGKRNGLLQGVLHLATEPVIEAGKHELSRKPEKWNRRNEGKADKGDHQPGAQLMAQDVALALEDELDDVSQHQIGQKQEQNDIEIDEAEEKDIAEYGKIGLGVEEPSFHEPEKNNEDKDHRYPKSFFMAAVAKRK